MSMSRLQRGVLSKQFPPLPSKPGTQSLSRGGRSSATGRNRRDYTPLSWEEFFDKKEQIRIDDSTVFNVYLKGDKGPVLFLLHGGGYSGLTWACFSKRIIEQIECRIVALDLRGHGDSQSGEEYNLSMETQTQDIGNVVSKLFGWDPPPIFMMGHSMGGALAVHTASRNLIPSLIGLCVIDVVEGSAMEALQSMQNFLRGRPDKFKTQEQAIEWCVRSGQVRNLESARVSMPAQIRKSSAVNFPDVGVSLAEEAEEDESKVSDNALNHGTASTSETTCYVWRIDLSRSEPFWDGWFRGLSATFLNVPVPKLLLLAGVDRLDKELTVGQMRGQFQMMVLPKVGHAVHEDSPEKVADAVSTFMTRNKFTIAIGEIHPEFPCC